MNKKDLIKEVKEENEKIVVLATGFGCSIYPEDLQEEKRKTLLNFDYLKNFRFRLLNLKINNKKTIAETSLSFKYQKNVAISQYHLFLDVHHFENGEEFGNLEIENKIKNSDYLYTETDLLNAINSINDDKVDKIIFENGDFDFYNILNKKFEALGNREKEIIDNLEIITEKENNAEHQIISFYALINYEMKSFDYDVKSKKIVG